MKIFLAGSGWNKSCWESRDFYNFNRLESFIYITEEETKNIQKYDMFLLDSGAFTYMKQKKSSVDWSDYILKYGEFVKNNSVSNYFELDIDNIVGLKQVKFLREKLESISGRQCIPVWHKSRGISYWEKMCQEYKYVAIGGIVTKEIKATEHGIFQKLIEIANKHNCKVHGLGYTNLVGLTKYKFHSVDSTSWLSGNRFGSVYLFDGKSMKKYNKPEGKRVKATQTAIHNFNEWVKFSKYTEEYL